MNQGRRTPEKFKAEKDALTQHRAGEIDSELSPGTIIAKRYRVLFLIGHGGMGSVYKVEQLLLNKNYALKTLQASTISDNAWRRFQQEAKAAALLDHPALIKVVDMGLIDEGHPFFVMELAEGVPLSSLLKSGPLPLDTVLEIFRQLSLGLGYAHSQGVIHRDLKPSNIIVQNSGSPTDLKVKVVDFGIAKVLGRDDPELANLTKTGEIFGTPHYMSPEQCLGRSIDERADIYSVGCVMFEALTGEPPFMSDNALATMLKHQSEQPPTLKEGTLGHSFSQDLEGVIAKLLAKNPRLRYQNLLDLAYDLGTIKCGEPIDSRAHQTLAGIRTRRHIWRTWLVNGFVTLVLILGALAIGYIAGRNGAHTIFDAPPRDKDVDSAKTWVDVPDIKFNQKYFSCPMPTPEGEIRYFHFPSDSLGELTQLSTKSKCFKKENGQFVPTNMPVAQNDLVITNFQPVGLRVDFLLAGDDNASLLKCFRADDLSVLNFDTALCTEQHLKNIEHCSKLRGLFLSDTRALTDQAIDSIDKLPQLQALDVNDSGITTKGLLRLKRLKSLKYLNVKKFADISKILAVLEGSNQIRYLFMRQCNLQRSDLQKLATMPNLRYLDLGRNGEVDANSLKYLTGLSHLEQLSLFGCIKFCPDSIPQLQKMHLKKLYFDETQLHWPAEAVEKLQAALPGCTISRTRQPPTFAQEISITNFLDLP